MALILFTVLLDYLLNSLCGLLSWLLIDLQPGLSYLQILIWWMVSYVLLSVILFNSFC